MSESNTIKPANVEAAASEGEQAERDELHRDVLDSYINKGPYFYYKGAPETVVFIDDGNQLSTKFDNEEVVEAMVKVAQSRGWGPMVVSGNDGFYKSAEKILNEVKVQNIVEQAERENKAVLEKVSIAQEPKKPEAMPDQVKANETDVVAVTSGAGESEQEAIETNLKERIEARKSQEAGIETDLKGVLEARREAALRKVNDQYRVAGSRYYFKDHSGNVSVLAFKDAGTKLSTTLNSERVSISLVDMAQSKGWDAIKVSGHSEFRRQVWREATERGIEVRGYKPTERDLASLNPAKENTVEKSDDPERAESRAPERAQATKTAPAINTGRIVSFGPAPYQHQKDASASYQVTIESDGKQRTVWGVDLQRAVEQSGANVGDSITLTYEGRKAVSVEIDQKDKKGVVIGTTTIQAHRNSWSIEQQDKAKVIEAVGSAVAAAKIANPEDRKRIEQGIAARIDAHQGPLPTVPMHDNARVERPTRKPEKEKAPELIR